MTEKSYQLVIRKGPRPGQVFPLILDMMTIGRDPMSDIVINDPEISRHHARLIRTDDGYQVQDMGSTNGSFVDGRRLSGDPMSLLPGHVLMMGSNVTLMYQATSASDPLATMVAPTDTPEDRAREVLAPPPAAIVPPVAPVAPDPVPYQPPSEVRPEYQEQYAQEVQQPPAYQEPAYQEPAYQEPAYQQPSNFQEPAYQEPAYQEPAYQQPNYQEQGGAGLPPLMPGQEQNLGGQQYGDDDYLESVEEETGTNWGLVLAVGIMLLSCCFMLVLLYYAFDQGLLDSVIGSTSAPIEAFLNRYA